MNFDPEVTAVCKRSDPLDDLAGERFNEARVFGSNILLDTDSFELQLEELGAGEGGSSFRDNLIELITSFSTFNLI